MCYPLLVQRLDNQYGCGGHSFVCNDDKLLFFGNKTSLLGYGKSYVQQCGMESEIRLDTVYGICYFYCIIYTLTNRVHFPGQIAVYMKAPLYMEKDQLEKRRKEKENLILVIPKIRKPVKMKITHRRQSKVLKDVTNLTNRLNQLQITNNRK